MPTSAVHPCAHPGCGECVSRGVRYCTAHLSAERHTYDTTMRDPQSVAFYSGAAWKTSRASYLRTHPVCEPCVRDRRQLVKATIVHHLVEIRNGGKKLDPANFEAVCPTCHGKIHPRVSRDQVNDNSRELCERR